MKIIVLHTDWCPYCPLAVEWCREIAKEEEIEFEAINIEKHPEILEKFPTKTVPTILVGEDNSKRIEGLPPSKEELKLMIESYRKGR